MSKGVASLLLPDNFPPKSILLLKYRISEMFFCVCVIEAHLIFSVFNQTGSKTEFLNLIQTHSGWSGEILMGGGAEVMQSAINHMASPRALIDQPCVVHGQPKYLKDPPVYHRISVKRFYFANTERKRPRPPPLLVLSLPPILPLPLCLGFSCLNFEAAQSQRSRG